MRPKPKRINKALAQRLTDEIIRGERRQIDVARELGVSRQAVNNWIRKRRHPELFAVPHKITDVPPKLSSAESKIIAAAIRSGPPSKFGLMIEEDTWVPIAVRDLIDDKLGRLVPIMTVENLVAEKQLSVQDHAPTIEGMLPQGRPWHKQFALPETPYKVGRRGGKKVATKPKPASTDYYRSMLRRT